MPTTQSSFEKGQTVIFKHYPEGKQKQRMEHQDGEIQIINDNSVDLIWLEGYKSRNEQVAFEDIVAIVDTTIEEISKIGPFKGHFRFVH